jgi:hypothetical protein
VVNAIRALLNAAPARANAWHAIAWNSGILVASVILAGGLFNRRES